MLKWITNNFWWKILSIVIAFVTWLVVVNYEDPQITRVFYDIEVEKMNVEAITSEKKAIEYKDGERVTVRVKGHRSIVEKMSSRDIIAYADLERKSITGAIDIEVEVPENISVIEREPSMMMVELENVITVQKEIQPYMEGEPSEGYIYLDPVVTPNNIEIEGPESKIALIKSILVPVNIEGVTRDVTLYGSPQILDDSNNIIPGLEKSASQIQIQVPIQKYKTVSLVEDIDPTVADGYKLLGLSLSQDTLQIRGPKAVLDDIDSLTISGLDLSEVTEGSVLNINVSSILPDNVEVYNDVSEITVSVAVEKIEEKTITIEHGDITVKHMADDLTFSYVDDEVYTVTFKGITSLLESIDLERISPSISLNGLEEGLQQVQLNVYVPSNVELITEKPIVNIELTKVTDDTTGLDASDSRIDGTVNASPDPDLNRN